MAERLETTDQQLPLIYNVSSPVGPGQTNAPDDVFLVQFLMAQTIPGSTVLRVQAPLPPVNGTFDLVTGFWIYEIEFARAARKIGLIDGIVSPARGINYAPGQVWLIASLNLKFKQMFPDAFDNLPNDPRLSPSLRAALQE
jgi:hypothetical protein